MPSDEMIDLNYTQLNEFLKKIYNSVMILCDQLNLEFPEINFKELYYSSGLEEKVKFSDKMVFGIYLEFIRGEIITAAHHEKIKEQK